MIQNKKTKDDDGFINVLLNLIKKKKLEQMLNLKFMKKIKKWGFRGNTEKSKEKNKYRVYPVYSDETDINS